MNNRVPTIKLASGEFSALGKRFPDETSMQAYIDTTIAKRERLAGRTLSPRELLNGIQRPALTGRDKLHADQWQPVMPPAAEPDPNPIRRLRAEMGDSLLHRDPRTGARVIERLTPKQRYAKLEKQFDEKLAAEAAADAHSSDPQRVKLIEAAESLAETVRYLPSATTLDVVRAEQAIRQAREGCLEHAKTMLRETSAKLDEFHAQRVAAVDEQLAALKTVRADMAAPFDAPAPKPRTFYPPDYAGPVPVEERERSNREYLAQPAENAQ